MLANFHFLRPWWFIAFIPAILLYFKFYQNYKSSENHWDKYCDSHLLVHLVIDGAGKKSNAAIANLLLCIWSLLIIALAGPTWSLYNSTAYQKNIARVIALDVSPSMNTTDVSPSRLDRAKFKVLDILKNSKEGQTGMVVFSSEPFVVSPLSSDSKTIANMVPVIDSSIVPIQGVDISKALNKSADLIRNTGLTNGQILLITGNNPNSNDINTAKQLSNSGFQVNILAVASENATPDINSQGNFADNNGNVTLSKIDTNALEQLANAGGGKFMLYTKDNSDVEYFSNSENFSGSSAAKNGIQSNLWQDQGHWLIWLAVLLALFFARKGWLNKLC